jgi:MbtH protein
MDETEDTRIYKVVVNHEEQYSIWFADREPPLGWREVAKTGPKAECLAYIKEVWTDMRPLSLRKKMGRGSEEALIESIVLMPSLLKELAARSLACDCISITSGL